MFQQTRQNANPFAAYMASVEADVNIDIDVNEAEEEGGVPEEPLDTSETPEASELEVQDADAEVESTDAVSDNVDETVTSLESLYLTLDMIASVESSMSDSTFALMQLHLNTIGQRLGADAGMLVPSTESDDWFLQRDITVSQEAILDRIKEGTKEFGNTIRKMYESVKTYVKTLASHHDRTAKRLSKVQGMLTDGSHQLGDWLTLSGRTGKRLAQGEQIADPASILQGAQALAKLAGQVLADRKGIQIYASAASMIAKDGNIDEARISSELQKAYPALKVAADENGNVPLMIGNTALFLTKGKGEADGLVRLGFKNGAAKVTGQRGFKGAAKSGAEGGKMVADAIGNSRAAGFAKKANGTIGKVSGAVVGGLAGAGLGGGVGGVAGGVGAVAGAVAGAGAGGVAGKKAGGALARGANKLVGAAGTKVLQGVGAGVGLASASRFDVTPLTEQQAKQFLAVAEALIAIVTKYEGDIEARNATNEQISKLLDEATTATAGEGEEVGKDTLKANAKLRRALGKSWKKTLKTETKVAAWVLNTAGALISYVGNQLGDKDEPEEAPEGGAAGGEE